MINTFETTFEARERLQQLEKIYQGEAVDLVASITTDGVPQDLTGYSIEGYYQPVEFKGTDDERTFYAVNAEIAGNKVKVHWTPDKDFGKGPYSIWALLTKEGDESYPVSWRLNLAHSPGYPVGETPEPIPQTLDFSKYTLLNAPWLTLTDAQVMDGKIDANTQAIAANTGSIVTLNQEVTQNAQDIATNAGNIATNTADIATNTQDIAALEEEYSDHAIKAALNDANMALPVTLVEWVDGEIQALDIEGDFDRTQAETIHNDREVNIRKICFGTKVTKVYVPSWWKPDDTGVTNNNLATQKETIEWERFCTCEQFLIPDSVYYFDFGFGTSDPNNSCESVKLPSRLTTIGTGGFMGWNALTKIDIPDTVTNIGIHAFVDLPNLKEINFGNHRTDGFPLHLFESFKIGRRNVQKGASLGSTNPKIVVPDAVYSSWIAAAGMYIPYLIMFSDWVDVHEYELLDFLETTEFDNEAYLTKTSQGGIDTSVVSLTDIGNKLNSILAILKRETSATTFMTYLNQTTAKMYVREALNLSTLPDYANITELKVGTAVKSVSGNPLMSNLTSVVLPEGLKSIGAGAFLNAPNLASINIPSSVTEIGNQAIPNTLPTLDKTTIPGAGILDGWTFYTGNTGSTATTIDLTGIKGITTNSFYYFRDLESLAIPASVIYIGEQSFVASFPNGITVDSTNTVYDSRNNCNAIIRTADNTLIRGSAVTVVPNNVTSLAYAAFSGTIFPASTSMTLPSSVKNIGRYAFGGTTNLTSLTITNAGPIIDGYFIESSDITSVTINSTTATLDPVCFYDADNLQTVTFNCHIKGAGNNMFASSPSITSVTFTSYTMAAVQSLAYYPWSLPTGCTIHCTDGDITL